VAEKKRCGWVTVDPEYVDYHDTEWGVPVHEDRRLFEKLILEGAQAGLSWLTVLRKRARYREVFAGFDPVKVARFDGRKVERLLADPGIIRNRAKVESAIGNAKAVLKVQREFGSFDTYVWGFVGGAPIVHRHRTLADVPAKTEESDRMSKDLEKRGFKFVGSTICYAYMQSMGLVHDHTTDCFRYRQLLPRNRR
jgi:DNA-3-methyladenine glycosylase I